MVFAICRFDCREFYEMREENVISRAPTKPTDRDQWNQRRIPHGKRAQHSRNALVIGACSRLDGKHGARSIRVQIV
jgi:hypothetical protein